MRLLRLYSLGAAVKINNLNIIANYLIDNPGARYTDITRHLCFEKGRAWSRGQYCRYFTTPIYSDETRYAHRLWVKSGTGGWVLSAQGMAYVTKYIKK